MRVCFVSGTGSDESGGMRNSDSSSMTLHNNNCCRDPVKVLASSHFVRCTYKVFDESSSEFVALGTETPKFMLAFGWIAFRFKSPAISPLIITFALYTRTLLTLTSSS